VVSGADNRASGLLPGIGLVLWAIWLFLIRTESIDLMWTYEGELVEKKRTTRPQTEWIVVERRRNTPPAAFSDGPKRLPLRGWCDCWCGPRGPRGGESLE
jgi:hypothetical protein